MRHTKLKIRLTNKEIKRVKTTIAKNFKTLRENNNISQQEMGKALRLHQTAICRIEKGEQDLTPYQMLGCCQIFGVSITAFYLDIKE